VARGLGALDAPPWQCSRPGWAWASWSSGRCPCLCQGG